MPKDLRQDLSDLAPGLDVFHYYDAWRLLVILWRAMWQASRTNWRAYALRIWDIFGDRARAAARMSRDLDAFISHMARSLDLTTVGTNEDERAEVARLLAQSDDLRRLMLAQYRHNLPVLMLLLRLYRDKRKAELEALDNPPTITAEPAGDEPQAASDENTLFSNQED